MTEGKMSCRFVMDYSLFRVAKQLRLLGFDTACSPSQTTDQLLSLAWRDQRILVTTSNKIMARLKSRFPSAVLMNFHDSSGCSAAAAERPSRNLTGYDSDGNSEYDEVPETVRYIAVQGHDPFERQIQCVMRAAAVNFDPDKVFSVCVFCNANIVEVPKCAAQGNVHVNVFDAYEKFYQCPGCRRFYWGVDNGVAVNYKAFRTLQRLHSLCVAANSQTAQLASGLCPDKKGQRLADMTSIHLLALPSRMKCAILSYLSNQDAENFLIAFPQCRGLTEFFAGVGMESYRGTPQKQL